MSYAAKIRAFLKKSADDQPDKGSETEEPAGLTAGGENMLAEKTEHFLKQVLSEVTKLPVGKIDAKAPVIDLQKLRSQSAETPFSADEVYDMYRKIGFDYGPAFRHFL